MLRSPSGFTRAAAVGFAMFALAFLQPAVPSGLSHTIVISQVYGGGGNSGAPYTHDFVELFNRGSAPASLAGWSIQYASATGTGNLGATATQITELPAVTLQPGQYYLVQQGGGATGAPLPSPDLVDPSPIAMAAGAGKVALVSSPTTLGCNGGSTPCSPAQLALIVDLIGYGGANFFEGSGAAPLLTNSTAAIRGAGGCIETDDNAADFSAGAPTPRTSAFPAIPCDGPPPQPTLSIDDVTVTEGDSGTVNATFTISLNLPAPAGGVTFDIATADGTATAADNDYEPRSLIGQSIPEGQQTFTFDVLVYGDTAIEPNEQFFVNVSNIGNALAGRTQGIGTILNDDVAPPVFDVVISQVYGGGGNSGATYTHDFVELFNNGTTEVSLGGWSVQYQSSAGTGIWQVTPLSGAIQPGGYYLVRQAQGSGGTTPLPTPDALGSIPMAGASGKVGLFAGTAAFSGGCPAGGDLIDLVGFGNTTCHEGAAPTAVLSNTLAAQRKRGGCFDSNDNGIDFLAGAPAPRNSASPQRSCTFQSLAIHDIQGSGNATPFLNQDVTTTGIVTALKANGFFLQTPDAEADADPATSQGVFVFTSGAPTVTVGDGAVVQGTATEFFNLTQIVATLPGDVTVTTTANPLPMPVLLTTTILDANGVPTQLEPLEGMRVSAPSLVAVAPTNQFGEIDTVLGGVPRPMREPGIGQSLTVPPDPITGTVDCCIPRWDENPERIMIDTDGLAGASVVHVTSITTLTGVVGPLDFAFGRYKVLPETAPGTAGGVTLSPVPAAAPNEFTVASYNIQNFSGTETQRRKAALYIRTVMRSPDIVGAIEIAALSSLEGLAAQIDADAAAAGEPPPGYAAYLIPAPSGGSQHVGFLVKSSRVTVHSVTQELADETLDGTADILHDRPPLVLRATIDPAGTHPGEIIALVNHTRSFIGAEDLDANGARVRAKRTQQAESIAQLLQSLQDANPTTPIIAVGDYNAFQFSDGHTDPIAVLSGLGTSTDTVVVQGSPDLVEPDFVNLTWTLAPAEQYTYVFEGTPQALDHVLVNAVGQSLFQRYAVARGNADFPAHASAGLVTDPARPEVNSDHDSPVAYFAFPGTPVVTLVGGAVINHEAFTPFVDPGATAHDDTGPLPVTVSGTVNVNVPGTYVLTYTASNLFQTTSVTRQVIVADTTAPVIDGFSLTPSVIGPPNHRMVDVMLSYTVTDASDSATCTVSVSSNEPPTVKDGQTLGDWEIVNSHHVRLRAARLGQGSGRIYTVTVTCADASGNTSAATATALVPHDKR